MKDKNAIIFEPDFFYETLFSVCGFLSSTLRALLLILGFSFQGQSMIQMAVAGVWGATFASFLARAHKDKKPATFCAAVGMSVLSLLHYVFATRGVETFSARTLSLIGLVVAASLMLPKIRERLKELKTKWKTN